MRKSPGFQQGWVVGDCEGGCLQGTWRREGWSEGGTRALLYMEVKAKFVKAALGSLRMSSLAPDGDICGLWKKEQFLIDKPAGKTKFGGKSQVSVKLEREEPFS